MTTKIMRSGPGVYAVTNGERTVTVTKAKGARGDACWQAKADWDNDLPSWNLPTKRDAVREAKALLALNQPDGE